MEPIVVLGARVQDGQPGALLQARLLRALDIAQPGQTILVSGRGESAVMAQFLRDRGAQHILEDAAATSTNENLENSRAMFPDSLRLIVVTNDFHVLRTRLWAWHLGIPVRVISAPTPPEKRLSNYLREVLATPHSIVRIAARRTLHLLADAPVFSPPPRA